MKRKPWMLLLMPLLMVLIIGSSILLSPKETLAAQPSVTLSDVKGDVMMRTGGGLHEISAVDGTKLIQGDWLRTGKKSSAKLVYEDGTEATIGANSLLNLQQLTSKETVGVSSLHRVHITAWKDGHQSSLELWAGSIWSKVKSLVNIDDKYEVQTPTAVMGVRGTLYLVSVDSQSGSTQSDVIDGTVGVGQNREGTQAAPVQLVTMGQTLKLASLTEPLPNQKAINPQELIQNTESEILVQLVNDVIQRTQELTDQTKTQQQSYTQTGDLNTLKTALGTSSKLVELSNFGKTFMNTLQTSEKIDEVKQLLQEKQQTLEQIQTTIDTIKTESEQTKAEVIEAAKDAGLSQDEIDTLENSAIGVSAPPVSTTTPTEPPAETPTAPTTTTTPTNSDKDDNTSTTPPTSTTEPLGVAVPISQETPITFDGGIKLDLGSLSIPTGATVKAEEVTPSGSDLPTDAEIAGDVVNFTFSGMTVNDPVSLTLPINSTADPNNVGIFYLNTSTHEWEYQDSTVVDGTVVATVNHFSTYGVLETKGSVNLVSQSLSSDGKQVLLTFDKSLNSRSIPAVKDFTVTDNGIPMGVSRVSISTTNDNIMVLDLADTVFENDQLKVSYAIGTKHIRDLTGNSAAGFYFKSGNSNSTPNDPEVYIENPGTNPVSQLTLSFYNMDLSAETLALSQPGEIILNSKVLVNAGTNSSNPQSLDISQITWDKIKQSSTNSYGPTYTLTLTLAASWTFNMGDVINIPFVHGSVKDIQGMIFDIAETVVVPSPPLFKVDRDNIEVEGSPGSTIKLYLYNYNNDSLLGRQLVGQPITIGDNGMAIFANIANGNYFLTQTLDNLEGIASEEFFAGPSSRVISGVVSLPEGPAQTDISIYIKANIPSHETGKVVVIPKGLSSLPYTLTLPANPVDQGYDISYSLISPVNYIQQAYYSGNNSMSAFLRDADPVDVSSQDQTGVNLSILNGEKITGTVSLPSGTAQADIYLTVLANNDNGTSDSMDDYYSWTEAVIKKDHASTIYTLTVPANSNSGYKLSYSVDSSDGYVKNGWYRGPNDTSIYQDAAVPVDVSTSDCDNMNLTLLPGNKISGTISLPTGVVAPSNIYVSVMAENVTSDDTSDRYSTSNYVMLEEGNNSCQYALTVPVNTNNYRIHYSYNYNNQDVNGWYLSGEGSSTVMTGDSLAAGVVDVSTDKTIDLKMNFYFVNRAIITKASALNGTIVLNMNGYDQAWYPNGPDTSMFTVTKSIDDSTPTPVDAVYAGGDQTTLYLNVPTVSATESTQSVVYSVSYMNEAPVSANPFVVSTTSAGLSITCNPTIVTGTSGSAITLTFTAKDAQGVTMPDTTIYLDAGALGQEDSTSLAGLWITQVNGQPLQSSTVMGMDSASGYVPTPVPLFDASTLSTVVGSSSLPNPQGIDCIALTNSNSMLAYRLSYNGTYGYRYNSPVIALTTGENGTVSITLQDGNVNYVAMDYSGHNFMRVSQYNPLPNANLYIYLNPPNNMGAFSGAPLYSIPIPW